jgi:hypothetical protein
MEFREHFEKMQGYKGTFLNELKSTDFFAKSTEKSPSNLPIFINGYWQHCIIE